jgi:integrase/recombinase XerC
MVEIDVLDTLIHGWISDGMCRQLSDQTIASRRHITEKFMWWIRHEGLDGVGSDELRAFLAYVGSAAPTGGRWGNPSETQKNGPRTVNTYWERLRTLFRWGVADRRITESPMGTIKAPISRQDQVQPFTQDQVEDLLTAAGRSRYPHRDTAICLFLLDTGVRASELCTLQVKDLELANGHATVLGKGNKRRSVYFDQTTLHALNDYLTDQPRKLGDYVFRGERGPQLTRSGLQQLINRLGEAAQITGVRCSPHTFRHTAAIWSIRNGMNTFALQTMLGHTDLTMTRRYVAIAQADLEEQHRRYGPVRRLSPVSVELPMD